MGLLEGKKIVVTGVLTDASLAFRVAQLAQREGAEIVLTGAGRALSLTQRTSRRLDAPCDVFEFDVTVAEHVERVREQVRDSLGRVDGVLHSIGFAPEVCLGDDLLAAQWSDVAVAMQISAYSLKTLVDAFLPLMDRGASVVGLDFDNTVAWPAYNWMGVAKAALEASVRYLAADVGDLGIRVNAISAGPIKTLAASGIGDFRYILKWNELNSPLKRNVTTEEVGGAGLFLLSDLGSGVTGEVMHVDSGYHVVGMIKTSSAPQLGELLADFKD